MAPIIKGAMIKGRTIVDELFDVDVDIENSRAGSYRVKLFSNELGREGSRIISVDMIAATIVPTVFGNVELTKDNWFYGLAHLIEREPNKKKPISLVGNIEALYGIQSVSTTKNIGQQFFRFHSVRDHDVAIMIDPGDVPFTHPSFSISEKRNIEGVQLFWGGGDTISDDAMCRCWLTDRTLEVRLDFIDTIGHTGKTYRVPFGQRIPTKTLLDIYLNGITAFKFEPSLDLNISRESDKFNDYLHWRFIGDVAYLETTDGQIKFYLREQDPVIAVESILSLINDVSEDYKKRNLSLSFCKILGEALSNNENKSKVGIGRAMMQAAYYLQQKHLLTN